jgi:predicted NBD/HSP70 family sugar kinase
MKEAATLIGDFLLAKPESTVQRVFQEIVNCETASIGQLARETGIQPQSLLGKLRLLVKKGFLVFSEGRAKVGINPGFAQVIGIDLGASHFHFALADFRGKILWDCNKRIRTEDGPRKLIAQIVEGARHLTAKAGGRLRAVAMGVPSPVETERGVVAFACNLPGWKNIHLAPPTGSAASDLAAERDAYFVFEAFRQGDPKARSVLERIFTMLGVGISNVVAILDPHLIVLGGGIVKGAPEFMLSTVSKVVQHIYKKNAPPIKLSALEDKAQTFGAIRSALTIAQVAAARRL